MPFCIEVGYFDTMKEIKEKVAKYHGIPVYEQTLIFKDKTLPDDLNIHNSDILDRSRIQLHIINNTTDHPHPHPPPQKVTVKTEEETTTPSSSSSSQVQNLKNKSMMIKLMLKSSSLGGVATTMMELDMNDSVLKLKEKIYEMELVNSRMMIIHANGIELHDDNKTLHECQLVDGSEVEIITPPLNKQQPTTTTGLISSSSSSSSLSSSNSMMMMSMGNNTNSNSNSNNNNNKKLKVNVMSKCGKKITLEVNPLNSVGELRKELHKVIRNNNHNNNNNNNNQGGFRLPEDGYFFIYKQNVMEEDQSFRWHRVAQGDTIEIFNGCVTGGGS
ncbi:Ubiquitin [Cynara cardunculus var. scolymus]|uniref:Ubiquitin n=2 Tax=Cynara cardunculus var. scolymus TaxID=59895 RepID=A0A103XK11_CYNCS|nr:Ubiquitin [Cynara cardunculus var. scolymus]